MWVVTVWWDIRPAETNSMEQSPSLEANSSWPSQEFRAFYVRWRFIAVLARARHCTTSCDIWIQLMTSPSLLLLFSRLCLRIPIVIFPSDFRTKILFSFLISPTRATFLSSDPPWCHQHSKISFCNFPQPR